MTTTAPERFMFDMDFSAPPPEESEVEDIPTVPLPDHEAAVALSEKQGYERGLVDGGNSAEAEAARALAQNCEKLVSVVEAGLAAADSARAEYQRDAVDLAIAAASALAAALVAREPDAEIRNLLEDCLGPLRRAPHLVVRTNEADVQHLREIADELASEKGFEGRLVLMGEPEIDAGDCRIEWADGGIVRDRQKIHEQIESLVSAYLSGQDPAPDPAPEAVEAPTSENGA